MGKHLNFVHNDEIWKDHVTREMQSFTRKWPAKWGFLTKEYQQMNRELVAQSPSTSPTPELDTAVKLPPITAPGTNTSHAFPVTTAQLIGWKSSRPECGLERYGKHARGKIGILKRFNWPQQGV